MSDINLNRLTPVEQWEPDFEDGSIEGVLHMVPHGNVNTITMMGGETFNHADLAFIALARKAFHVMIRRGWSPSLIVNGVRTGMWIVVGEMQSPKQFEVHQLKFAFDDPFTALVEADKWYRDNMENK